MDSIANPDQDSITRVLLERLSARDDREGVYHDFIHSFQQTAERAVKAEESSNLHEKYKKLEKKVLEQRDIIAGKKENEQRLQDEVLAGTIQINVLQDKLAQVQTENKHLVDRWMARITQEAERLNDANAFLQNYQRLFKPEPPPGDEED